MITKIDLINKIAKELEKLIGVKVADENGVGGEIARKVDAIVDSFKDELIGNSIQCYVDHERPIERPDKNYDFALSDSFICFSEMIDYIDENNYEGGDDIAEIFVNTSGKLIYEKDEWGNIGWQDFEEEEVTSIALNIID